MGKTAFIFTGQGSQFSGMGKDFYDNYDFAKKVFDRFDELSPIELKKTCFEGDEENLKQTINSQPCIVAVELAILETLKNTCEIEPDYVAGHSLGEYSAMYCAGVLDLDTTINLINKRAEAMNKVSTGSMSAILGLKIEEVEQIVKETQKQGYVDIANYNSPEQFVITGDENIVKQTGEIALIKGATKVVPLAVSGAFHSKLMQAASENFANAVLNSQTFDAKMPVITNVDAQFTTQAEDFKPKMIKQIYSSVMWLQTMLKMREEGVTNFVEIGPKKILTGLVRRTFKDVDYSCITNTSDLEKFTDKYKQKLEV